MEPKIILSKLPVGWITIKLEEICKKITDGTHYTPQYTTTGIPFISVKDITNSIISFEKCRYISEEEHRQLIKRCNPEYSDVLITKSGTIGRTAVVKDNREFSLFVSVALIKPCKKHINSNYLAYSLKNYINSIDIQQSVKGGVIKNLHIEDLKEILIPLPPFAEQHRIVSRIEELFSHLDAGVEGLHKVKAQIKRYRQSVLKAAVEGSLTVEWRKAHPEIEPARNLLKLIDEKRHNGKRKANDVLDCDLYDLPNLPDSWAWTNVGGISELIQYGTSEKAGDDPTGIPIIRMGNIQDGKLDFEKLKYIPKDYPEIGKFFLRDGDILFNRTNSSELVGKTAVYKNYHPKSIFASYLIKVEVDKNFYNPDFLSYFINSNYGRKYIAAVVSQQVGQANVNGTKLSSMTIPLLSIQEQEEIVQEVERSMSESSDVEIIIDSSLIRANHLRKSILKRAFEGKLVPQDPNDEPASMLLEQIKAGRIRTGSSKDKRSRPKTLSEFSG